MKEYYVDFVKKGEIFKTVVCANSADEARQYIAEKYQIRFNFEVIGDYYDDYAENNHVNAVKEIAA